MPPTAPNAVVTGANSGIGLETARGLARAGYHVILGCRDPGRAEAAEADIAASVPGASTEIVLGDLGVLSSVRDAAAEIARRVDRLDLLVNNAGIAMRKMDGRTSEDHDPLLAVNHLGPFLFTNLLLPLLEAGAPSRVVTVASDAHRMGRVDLEHLDHPSTYGILGFRQYGATKLMNILFTRELARRVAGTGITANSVHPGGVATNIGGPGRVISAVTRRILLSPEQGAATSLYVATSPEGGAVSGSYFAKSKRADGKLSKRARDDVMAAALWARTAELVGLS